MWISYTILDNQFTRKIGKRLMSLLSLKPSLLQLRELIVSGAETSQTLQCFDRLLSAFVSLTRCDGRPTHNKALLNELKVAHKLRRELEEDNSLLKESVANMQIDLEMARIRIKNAETQLRDFKHAQDRLERPALKPDKHYKAETAVQCEILSPDFVEELKTIARRTKSDDFRSHPLQQNQSEVVSETKSEISTTTEEGSEREGFVIFEAPDITSNSWDLAQSSPASSSANLSQHIVSWLQAKADQLRTLCMNQ